jgi:hypothetical protein
MQPEVAEIIAMKADTIWNSQEAMGNFFKEKFNYIEHQGHERTLVNRLIRSSWEEVQAENPFKISMTKEDLLQIILQLAELLDANIWSQIYLNCELWTTPLYDLAAAIQRMDLLQVKFARADESPWMLKAKMREDEPENLEWNEALALLKSAKAVRAIGVTSYRLYPYGSTPAFTDTCGISNINSKFWDPYILHPKGNRRIEYYEGMDPVNINTTQAGIEVEGFGGVFVSKSGDIGGIARTLTIREFMRDRFVEAQGKIQLIPRWSGCTIID